MAYKDPTKNREYQREYYRKNRAARLAHDVRYARRRKYGEGADVYADTQLDKQNGVCAVCAVRFDRSPNLDHNHRTGQWRGMLCFKCNVGLHHLENEDWRRKAEAYLAEWNRAWGSNS